MGETLGIAHNVFEKMEREKDRKERLKKYEGWLKEQERRRNRLKDIQARLKEAEKMGASTSPLNKRGSSVTSLLSVDNENLEMNKEKLKKYEEWRREKKQSLLNMRALESTSPLKKELGSRSSSAAIFTSKDEQIKKEMEMEFSEFEAWRLEQEQQSFGSKAQTSQKDARVCASADSLAPAVSSKRCNSASGLQSTEGTEKQIVKDIKENTSSEWVKSKSVSKIDSQNSIDLPEDFCGSKLKMTSFIGSSTIKTMSVPKDLEEITLDENQSKSSMACGKCVIL